MLLVWTRDGKLLEHDMYFAGLQPELEKNNRVIRYKFYWYTRWIHKNAILERDLRNHHSVWQLDRMCLEYTALAGAEIIDTANKKDNRLYRTVVAQPIFNRVWDKLLKKEMSHSCSWKFLKPFHANTLSFQHECKTQKKIFQTLIGEWKKQASLVHKIGLNLDYLSCSCIEPSTFLRQRTQKNSTSLF